MKESLPEKSEYTEEEALTEAERLSKIVKGSRGTKDYADAERWLKEIKHEVRPMFDEKEFRETQDTLHGLFSWDWESKPEDERRAEIARDLPKLLGRKAIFIEAYEYKYKRGLLYDIARMAQGRIEGGEDNDREKMKKFGMEVISELSQKIVRDLQKGRSDPWALNSINLLAESPDDAQQKTGVDALDALQGVIEKGLSDKNDWRKYFKLLELIREKGTTEQQQRATETAVRAASRIENKQIYGKLITFLLKDQPPEITERGLTMLKLELAKHHLPAENILNLWKKSGPRIEEIVDKNISAIVQLESEKPGICEFLYREFGVADFGRYPVDLLLKQYDEVNNLENPYGVILFPRNDWNGAFYQDNFALGEFFQKLEGEFSLRVFECDGKIGLARALIRLNRKYNPPNKKGHKISLAIVGGHGTENSIRFGGNEERDTLYLKDLMGKGAKRTSEFFEESPTIILISCSTGVDRGIGQKLSKVMGAKVIAPRVPTNIQEIQVGRRRKGKFRFNAKYESEEKDTKSVYVAGAEMQKHSNQ